MGNAMFVRRVCAGAADTSGYRHVQNTVKVWGQDASWLMNLTEQAKEWVDVTDGSAASSIFGNYGFTPDPGNLDCASREKAVEGKSLKAVVDVAVVAESLLIAIDHLGPQGRAIALGEQVGKWPFVLTDHYRWLQSLADLKAPLRS